MKELKTKQEVRAYVESKFHERLCDCYDIGGSLQDMVEWYLEKTFDEVVEKQEQ